VGFRTSTLKISPDLPASGVECVAAHNSMRRREAHPRGAGWAALVVDDGEQVPAGWCEVGVVRHLDVELAGPIAVNGRSTMRCSVSQEWVVAIGRVICARITWWASGECSRNRSP
jgi:hypothetical protein